MVLLKSGESDATLIYETLRVVPDNLMAIECVNQMMINVIMTVGKFWVLMLAAMDLRTYFAVP
ncbi:MAG: hypothetical protein ACD_58C00047G0001 [uncultured bacterium]|nr:MAG: hypothetical protein ACD_58C00047G0001 [uncultured bacterium]